VQGYLYGRPLAPSEFERWICAEWTVERPRRVCQADAACA
jgi:hypothetical protein